MAFTIDSPYGQLLYDQFPPGAQNDHLAILMDAYGSMFDELHALVAEQGTDGDPDYVPGWGALFDLDRCPTADLPYLAQYVGVQIPTGTSDAAARALIQAEGGMHRGTVASIRSAIERNISVPWAPDTAYTTGQMVLYSDPFIVGQGIVVGPADFAGYYLATANFTSGSTFDQTHLSAINPQSQYQLYERATASLAVDAYQLTVIVNPAQLTPVSNTAALVAAVAQVKPAGLLFNVLTAAAAPLVNQYTRNFSAITAQLALADLADVT